jgi:TP901 family phage tail tape measure protein
VAPSVSFGINIDSGAAVSSLGAVKSALSVLATQAKSTIAGLKTGVAGALGDLGNRANDASQTMTKALLFEGMQQAGSQIAGVGRSITTGVMGALQGATQEAVQLETAMAEVSKVTGLQGAPLKALEGTLVRLSSTEIPSTAAELAEIAAAGGSLGVATKDLDKFVGSVAKMSVAFGMSTGDTGQKIGEVANGFKMLNPITGELDFKRVETFGNVVNYLADTMATSEAKVINSMQRMTGNAMYGFTENNLAAIAASMTSLGIAPEVAATSLNTTVAKLAAATTASEGAQEAFAALGFNVTELQQGFTSGKGMETFEKFIRKVSSMGAQAGPLLSKAIGLEASDEIARLAGSLPLLDKALKSTTDSIAGKGSTIGDSMKIMAGTSAAQAKLMQNAIVGLQLKVGTIFDKIMAPVRAVTTIFANFATGIVDRFPAVAYAIVGVGLLAAAFGTILTIGGGLIAAIGAIGSAWIALPTAIVSVTAAFGTISGVMSGFAASLGAAFLPVLPLALPVILAIAAAAFIIYRFWGPIKTFFKGVMDGIRDGFLVAQSPMAEFRSAIGVVAEALQPAFNFLKSAFKTLFLDQMPEGGSQARSFGQFVGHLFGVMVAGLAMVISGWAKLFAVLTKGFQWVGVGLHEITQGTHSLVSPAISIGVAYASDIAAKTDLFAKMTVLSLQHSWTTLLANWQAFGAGFIQWVAGVNLAWVQIKTWWIAQWGAASSSFFLFLSGINLAWVQIRTFWGAQWSAVSATFVLFLSAINLAWVQFKTSAIAQWDAVASIFTTIWSALSEQFQAFKQGVQAKIAAFTNAIIEIFSAIGNAVAGVRSRIQSLVPGIPAPVAAAATAVAAPVATAVAAAANAAPSIAAGIGGAVSGAIDAMFGNDNKPIPNAATGSIPRGSSLGAIMAAAQAEAAAAPSGAGLVMANSSEFILPPDRLQTLLRNQSASTESRTIAGGNVFNNHFTISISSTGGDAASLADQIVHFLDIKLQEELAAQL